MAYMNQEKKKKLAPQIKAVLKKYSMKGTVAVRNHSSLVVNLKEGRLDIIGNYNAVMEEKGGQVRSNYMDVNQYWIDDNYTGEVRDFLNDLKDAMNGKGTDIKNHDRSDTMTDYFDVGWWVDINVGHYNKPYRVV